MKLISSFAAVVFSVSALSTSAFSEEVSTYRVDPVHSFVLAKVVHLGAGNAWGRFNEMEGVFKVNEKDPSASEVDFTVQTASVDTNNEQRDEHLRGPDFFDAKQFPTITFKSKSVEKVDDKNYKITGDITVKGTTKPITADFEFIGKGEGMQGEQRLGGEARFNLKRSDFGMTYMVGPLSDDVELIVSVEGVQEK